MANGVEQFAEHAKQMREWVLVGTESGSGAARTALILITRLYLAALSLPPWAQSSTEGTTDEGPMLPGWQEIHSALAARLPIQHYGEVFNPLTMPPEESIVADLADDLADIFGDVCQGLWWLEAGNQPEAVWAWGFGFVHHWGEHATAAIRALHSWLTVEAPELLATAFSPDHSQLPQKP